MTTPKPLSVPLFVPGHRPELLAKAGASGVDAVILDLEDAVSDAHKPAAHAALMSRPDFAGAVGRALQWIRLELVCQRNGSFGQKPTTDDYAAKGGIG
jgi:hypothetical protein